MKKETNTNKIYEKNSLINQNANYIEENQFKKKINNNHVISQNYFQIFYIIKNIN